MRREMFVIRMVSTVQCMCVILRTVLRRLMLGLVRAQRCRAGGQLGRRWSAFIRLPDYANYRQLQDNWTRHMDVVTSLATHPLYLTPCHDLACLPLLYAVL